MIKHHLRPIDQVIAALDAAQSQIGSMRPDGSSDGNSPHYDWDAEYWDYLEHNINLAKQIKEDLTPAWHEDCPHVPHTPQMVRDFIGNNFNSYSYGDKERGIPHTDDMYNVSAHDLMKSFYGHFSFDEGGPNARLAASAPQLLNALQALVSAVEAVTLEGQQEQPAMAQAIGQAKQVSQQVLQGGA